MLHLKRQIQSIGSPKIIFTLNTIFTSRQSTKQPTMATSSLSSSSSTFTQITSLSSHYNKPHFNTFIYFSPPSFTSKITKTLCFALSENSLGSVASPPPPPTAAAVVVADDTADVSPPVQAMPVVESNGAVASAEEGLITENVKFENPKWINGTWDLTQFQKDGKTDWDAVIDAEVRRRKWLQDTPESSSNDNPVSFDTSIIPWWAWMKRFHLPEAELLNGRAAMVGFFMAYFVDSLTGVGLVDQMGNFFCKTLLFAAVAGVLLIRKNEDVEKVKKLIDETTFYDKQWQATWQDETTGKSKRN